MINVRSVIEWKTVLCFNCSKLHLSFLQRFKIANWLGGYCLRIIPKKLFVKSANANKGENYGWQSMSIDKAQHISPSHKYLPDCYSTETKSLMKHFITFLHFWHVLDVGLLLNQVTLSIDLTDWPVSVPKQDFPLGGHFNSWNTVYGPEIWTVPFSKTFFLSGLFVVWRSLDRNHLGWMLGKMEGFYFTWRETGVWKRTYVSAVFLLRSHWCRHRCHACSELPAGRCRWWRASDPSGGRWW